MKTKIILHGKIAKIYGSEFEFANINKPSDALDAIEMLFPGFKKYITNQATKNGMCYEMIANDDQVVSCGNLKENSKEFIKTIDVVPSIYGQKKVWKKFKEIIVGVILIVAAIVFAPSLPVWAVAAMSALGVGLIITGIVYLTTSIPETEPFAGRVEEMMQEVGISNLSYAFSSPVNMTRQGQPVGLGYGTLRVGSSVIQSTLTSFDLENDRQPGNSEISRSNALLKIQEVFGNSSFNLFSNY